ncbi:hypothetical protein WJX84_001177 [Apatococcus fuscideae]|uniref:digalactosyldiacylglycerol synthase n=1 Tax=Apatococcus fuscideae TaxID=2026836 RepID=A0AAW1SWA9_9CHLO
MGRDLSSLRESGRHIAVFTTASLPWLTGTSVNATLRAAYLAKICKEAKVTIVLPWLGHSDQKEVYPHDITFQSPDEQEAWVRNWVEERVHFKSDYKIRFYAARFAPFLGSVFPVGDLTKSIPAEEADVAVLEEPEHLTWFHHGQRWTDAFRHVVGVIHTNYVDYIRRGGGRAASLSVTYLNRRVCCIHCHKVIKLSDAVQSLPRQVTCFVHGVPPPFLEVGQQASKPSQPGEPRFSKGAYFVGKLMWAKGFTEMLDMLSHHKRSTGEALPVDAFGSGPDADQIRSKADEQELQMTFPGRQDHLDDSIRSYRVLVNPSTSDVVATTSCEALAMGKWIVCAEHPSNQFFKAFQNALIYKDEAEFSQHLAHAMANDPHPMSEEDIGRLSWEQATERFLVAAQITPKEWPGGLGAFNDTIQWHLYNAGIGLEVLRKAVGAGQNTGQQPESVKGWDPEGYERLKNGEYHQRLGYVEPRLL